MNLFRLSVYAVLLISFVSTGISVASDLVISNWGGSYIEAQRDAYIDRFIQQSSLDVELKQYSGGIAPLRDSVEFDVIDMVEFEARAACKEGLLLKFDRFDRSLLSNSPGGTPAIQDFINDAILDCGIAHLEYATVLAYNDRDFTDEKPNSVKDFFDLDRFPGKRALRKNPHAILEWALLSYDVPSKQIYDLLSTERGLRLVSRRLDEIRDHIVWWENGSEPIEMLQSGEVVMASGYNGRFFNARVNNDIPISVIQDGQLLEFGVWVIPKKSFQFDAARRFIRFATRTENMAAMGNLLPYAPTRSSAMRRIGLHSKSNVSMISYMPSSTSLRTVRLNSTWYAQTEDIRERWFENWLQSN